METLLQRCITHGQEQVSIYHGQAGQMNQDVDKCFLTEFLLRRTNCVDWVLSHWSIINFIQKYSLWSFSWLIAVVFWFCGMVQLKEVSSSSATVFLPLFSVTWQFFYCRTGKDLATCIIQGTYSARVLMILTFLVLFISTLKCSISSLGTGCGRNLCLLYKMLPLIVLADVYHWTLAVGVTIKNRGQD